MSRPFRTYHELSGPDRSQVLGQVDAQRKRVTDRLASVARVIPITSGKGGVGKSFVTARLAQALAAHGHAVGVLDADLNGPTIPRLLELQTPPLRLDGGIAPGRSVEGISVFSMAYLLEDGAPLKWRGPEADAFVWRDTLEIGAIRELLSDVVWGSLDVLLIDLPPGAARLIDLQGLVPAMAGVIAVTIPSDESYDAVQRALTLARERDVDILAVVENMATARCPACDHEHPLFDGQAGANLSAMFDVSPAVTLPFFPAHGDLEALADRVIARSAAE